MENEDTNRNCLTDIEGNLAYAPFLVIGYTSLCCPLTTEHREKKD
jgi:hypothetical protein